MNSRIFLTKVFPIVIFSIYLITSSCSKELPIDQNSKAFLLDTMKYDKNKVYNLSGNWDFYWDTLLSPQEISTTKIIPHIVQVPSQWTNYMVDGKKLPKFGFATYHTKIVANSNQFYAFKLERIYMAFNLYVNDTLIYKAGQVSNLVYDFKPERISKTVIFYSTRDTIDVVLQVANFSHRKAGILKDIKIGSPQAINRLYQINIISDMLIIGALTIMLLLYLFIFLYENKNRINIYLSIFLFVQIVTISLDRELIFTLLFPFISWAVASKLFFLFLYLRLIFFVYLIESYTREYFSKVFKYSFSSVCLLIIIFITLTPMHVYSYTLIPMIFLTFIGLIYEVYVLHKSALNDKKLFIPFVGVLILIITTINDSLLDFGLLNTFYSSGIGVFAFTLTQAVYLSDLNAQLLYKEEKLTNKLAIEQKLKQSILSKPSYDLPASLYSLIEILNIQKVNLFTRDSENFYFYISCEKNKPHRIVNEIVDFENPNENYNIQKLKISLDALQDLYLEDTNSDIKSKSLLIIPIIKDGKATAILYIESFETHFEKETVEVLVSLKNQFKIIINTAIVYFELQQLNKELEQKVKERSAEVELQNFELDVKNSELQENIKLLQQQNNIQNELNDELNSQVAELETQNEALEYQNQKLIEQKEQIQNKQNQIERNINYAKTIHSLLSVKESQIPFEDFFHLEIPKDIVSGDFLFTKKYDDLFVFALADCTGHGVPGALMNIYANRELLKITNEEYSKNKEIDPAVVLNTLREQIKKRLSNNDVGDIKDGLDIVFCTYNTKTKNLSFAGAYNAIYILRDENILTLKGDRMPIGSYVEGFEFPFTLQNFQLEKNDYIYAHTDGYVDQFSSDTKEKFYASNFKNMLLKIHKYSFKTQKETLRERFIAWKGYHYQLDDVSVIGIKI